LHYLKTEFFWDFIPILPFQLLTLPRRRENLFFLIKLLRLRKGFKILDVTKLKGYFKYVINSRMERRLEWDEGFANNMLENKNPVQTLLFTGYFLKTLQLTIIIVNLSYIIGMLFFIMCEFNQDFIYDVDYHQLDEPSEFEPENFISYFGLYDKSAGDIAVIVSYYMFTSLSTVGFGDYHPRSNSERLVVTIILLFGVAIQSYIMGNFADILSQFKSFNDELEEGDLLTKFFGTLVKFNGYKKLDLNFQRQMEQYFNYRWSNDLNAAFRESADLDVFY
jgi:hypothetical protein